MCTYELNLCKYKYVQMAIFIKRRKHWFFDYLWKKGFLYYKNGEQGPTAIYWISQYIRSRYSEALPYFNDQIMFLQDYWIECSDNSWNMIKRKVYISLTCQPFLSNFGWIYAFNYKHIRTSSLVWLIVCVLMLVKFYKKKLHVSAYCYIIALYFVLFTCNFVS